MIILYVLFVVSVIMLFGEFYWIANLIFFRRGRRFIGTKIVEKNTDQYKRLHKLSSGLPLILAFLVVIPTIAFIYFQWWFATEYLDIPEIGRSYIIITTICIIFMPISTYQKRHLLFPDAERNKKIGRADNSHNATKDDWLV